MGFGLGPFLMDRKMIMNQEEDKEEDEVGKK